MTLYKLTRLHWYVFKEAFAERLRVSGRGREGCCRRVGARGNDSRSSFGGHCFATWVTAPLLPARVVDSDLLSGIQPPQFVLMRHPHRCDGHPMNWLGQVRESHWHASGEATGEILPRVEHLSSVSTRRSRFICCHGARLRWMQDVAEPPT